MFGLMRVKSCGMTPAEKEFRRQNYCGTCKTIGAVYGAKARLLLNHDAVFLAEILSSVSGEKVENAAIASLNCLKLPKSGQPKALQFAAATNVVLTEFKLADHIEDESKRRHKIARNALSDEFEKAAAELESWNFPLDDVKALLSSQSERENAGKSLSDFAFPTAETTGVFFREGFRFIGREEIADEAFRLGFAFGKLVYLVDAFEDYEKDVRGGKFNAFRAAFGLTETRLTGETKRRLANLIREAETEVAARVETLPFAENQKNLFVSRLSQNLARKLKTNLPVLGTKKVCATKPKRTFRDRWNSATAKAKALAYQYRWQMPLVFLFVFAFALVAPAQTREARTPRECFDLGFNLIFLGSIFGAVLAFPKSILMDGNIKKKRTWCDWCDCECCCDCDCCCDGFCDGCNCCDCSCD